MENIESASIKLSDVTILFKGVQPQGQWYLNLKFLENYQYALDFFLITLIRQEWNILASQMLAEIKSDSHGTKNSKLAAIKKTNSVYNGQERGRN